MSSLQELTRQLAEGTRSQKRRSWRSLVLDAGLWEACQTTLHEPEPLARLTEAYRHLTTPWDRSPLYATDLDAARRVEEQISVARRTVAAAALTAAARGASGAALLSLWAMRAAGHSGPVPALPQELPAAEPGEGRIRACFRGLYAAGAQPPAELAAAQDASLSFLWGWLGEATRPSYHRVRVPVLLARGTEGYLAWLWLERMRSGFGQLFQAPDSLLSPVLPDLRRTIEEACGQARLQVPAGEDVRWWLTELPLDASGHPLPVGGASAAATAAVGLSLLLRGASVRSRCAITATLLPGGRLGAVQGLQGAGPKLWAARALAGPGDAATVIVSPESQLTGTAAAGWMARGVRVVAAHTLEEAEHLAAAAEYRECRSSGTAASACTSPRPRAAILYVRHADPDARLRDLLECELRSQGYDVDTERDNAEGVTWAREAERRIRSADLVVVLLTPAAAGSEMLAFELELAHEAAQATGKPRLVIVNAGEARLPDVFARSGYPCVPLEGTAAGGIAPSVAIAEALRTPDLSKARLEPELLVPPTGVLPLGSEFYLERAADREFRSALIRRDSTVRIKGARQMGKTSLLARGLEQARAAGATVVLTDFQLLNQSHMESIDVFLLALARHIARQVPVDLSPDATWDPLLGASVNFRGFLLELLPKVPGPVVWGLDEVDRLFTCDFRADVFGLLRSLHNERALDPSLPWSRLTLTLCYATEANLFLADLNQSPFNVGTRLPLHDFALEEVAELNRRYEAPLRSAAELTAYFDLLAGHPYLTHRGLHAMAAGGVSLEELRRRSVRDDGLFGDHLRRLLLLLARDTELSAAVGEVLRGRPCPSPESFHRLWSAGVLVGDSSRDARPRCRLYAEYLERNLL